MYWLGTSLKQQKQTVKVNMYGANFISREVSYTLEDNAYTRARPAAYAVS